jgi:hypothetical protein
MVAIVLVSSRSSITIGRRNLMPKGPVGNLLHIAAFACLGYFLSRALDPRGASAGLAARAGKGALLIAALFGVSDEIHQFFVPGRLCSLFDVFLDAAGATFALVLPRLAGGPRRRSVLPAAGLLTIAIAVALTTGYWRPPGDDAIESALSALGFSRS